MRPQALFAIGAAALAATLVGMTLLPHKPYVRWQNLRTEAYARYGWVYERVHDDPTPVDIAFVGTSHTMNGVDAALVAQKLGQAGARTPAGQCPTATNFAMPNYGRNLHWLVAREVLENRPVKLLVLEVLENESRKPHPQFVHIAKTSDILGAPLLVNINYLADIVRLPFRQASLAVESLAPEQFGLKSRFDPANYDGSTVDNTRVVNVDGRALTPARDTILPASELDAAAEDNLRNKNLHMLPGPLSSLEFNFPRSYLRRILELADKKGVKVVLFYLPGYGQPPEPYDMRDYAGREMLKVNDILADKSLWLDVNHLNAEGARRLSERLAGLMAPEFKAAGTASAGQACSNGLPPRPSLKPFHLP
jgi:hypothetical protein